MSSRQEDKVIEGVRPFLEAGEEVQGAIIARPRGWTQARAGSLALGGLQQRKARKGAEEGGFELASPMALVLTQRRLLSFKIGSPIGMGAGGEVKDLVGSAPIAEVDSIEIKRLLLGKVVNVSVRGVPFKLEVNAKANASGLADAFNRATA
jgi:hypothetical protein